MYIIINYATNINKIFKKFSMMYAFIGLPKLNNKKITITTIKYTMHPPHRGLDTNQHKVNAHYHVGASFKRKLM